MAERRTQQRSSTLKPDLVNASVGKVPNIKPPVSYSGNGFFVPKFFERRIIY